MSLRVLKIGPEEQAAIDGLIAAARQNVIPWAVLQQYAVVGYEGPVLSLDQRKGAPDRPAERHIRLGEIDVCLSYEEQPDGICQHLSISVPEPGALPHVEMVKFIAEAFHMPPPGECMMWVEEYAPGEYAANVLAIVEPALKGTVQ